MVKFHDLVAPYTFTRSANYAVDTEWGYLIKDWIPENQKKTGLDLDPEFQRVHVWTEEQQIRYVEYIMRGGMSGKDLYFNCSSWMKGYDTPMVLVDGKQRLEAVRRFIENEIPAFGVYNKDIERLSLLICSFKVHINDLQTEKEVLQWYVDLNAGGTPHTKEEIEKVKRMIENV